MLSSSAYYLIATSHLEEFVPVKDRKPPLEGDAWRMDFSRFNVKKGSAKDSGGWAWSSHGVWDSCSGMFYLHRIFG